MVEIELLIAGSLQSSPHAGQWRAQIMGHVVGDLTVRFDQFPDAIEHRIEIFREPIPFVTGPAQRDALSEPASHYFSARRVDRFDPCHRAPRGGYSGRGCEDQKQHGCRGETDRDVLAKSVEIFDVAAEKQMMTVRQDLIRHTQRRPFWRLRLPIYGRKGSPPFVTEQGG